MRSRSRARPTSATPWPLLAVLAALVFVAYVRLRVADVPLERDEGEYAYAGQLILQGIPPYELAYNMKFPGIYYAYAAILALFGPTPGGIHLGLMVVNAATILLVWRFGRRILGEFAGAIAAVSFAILGVDRWVFGVFAHATHFVNAAAMAGLYVLLRAIDDDRTRSFALSGALLGLAVLMKQHAIFFLPLGAALVVWGGTRSGGIATPANAKRIGALALGALLPFGAILLVLLAQGVLGRFWFWTFQYASAYVSENSFSTAWSNFTTGLRYVTAASWAFWVLGALGLVSLWARPWKPATRTVVTALLVASLLALCPGFYFREHYFILVLPALALLVGIAVDTLRQLLERSRLRGVAAVLSVAVFVGAIGLYVTKERRYLFSMGTRELSRTMFGTNPFIEAVEIGKYIKEHTDKNDRIAVLGSEPEIYFYADRKAATGYIYTYPLMEPQPYAKSMQQEMIREIESSHPRYLVYSALPVSWAAQKESDQGIVHWGNRYLRDCYDPVGIVDIFSDDKTNITWDDAARSYVAKSADLVFTCKRKSDAPCSMNP